MRNRHILLLDSAGLLVSTVLATLLGMEHIGESTELWRSAWIYLAILTPTRIVVAQLFGLYSSLWQHASLNELERIVKAWVWTIPIAVVVGISVLPLIGVLLPLPVATVVLDVMLALGVFAAPRLGIRYTHIGRQAQASGPRTRTLVVGAGEVGQSVLRASLAGHSKFKVVAFVDDDSAKAKTMLNGVYVYGKISELPKIARELAVSDVIIAIANARGALVRSIVEMAASVGATTRTVPSLNDLVSGRVQVSQLRPVEIEDLLRRDAVSTDLSDVRKMVTDQVVLVTGAGGSIGSEICRQVSALEPSLLVLLDHSENQIFEIANELREHHPSIAIAPVIADIRDGSRITNIFEKYRPQIVFHAAAHKHVPLMEDNVVEAITNNILGTRNVVEAASLVATSHFVLISTDKAVRPTSIMGATKRLAEALVRRAATTSGRHYVVVRFGNVLGSRGSVVPTFLAQINRGGPVTVTHPEMRRYFMTIPEAVQLVLQAGALGDGGELFVLDMGNPVRIADLARDLIRLSGLEEGSDIELRFTGLRPGEKLYEEILFGHEDVRQTNHPKILRTLAEVPDTRLVSKIDELIRQAQIQGRDDNSLRACIVELVPDFISEAPERAEKVLPLYDSLPGPGRVVR
jgi:FlaA1/EpsC-like NDP-sugar epimerase